MHNPKATQSGPESRRKAFLGCRTGIAFTFRARGSVSVESALPILKPLGELALQAYENGLKW